ncbi:hypothetical protein DWW31_18110 [Clostridium sp. AF15-17LB]|nr:hypothetical protein DWW31_18110 [Clostridium sp. AF15-17LB]
MKKVLCVFLVVYMCCGLIVGCGDKSGENESKLTTVDFNKEDNQVINLKDIQFDIPHNWKQQSIDKHESPKSVVCFKSDDIYLKVIHGGHKIEDLSDDSFKAFLTGLGIRFGGFEIGEIENKEFDGNKAKVCGITFNQGTTMYKGHVYALESADFVFGVKSDATTNYAMDIQKVLESIKTIEYNEELEGNEENDLKESSEQTESKTTTYQGGMYKIGSDMSAGEYLISGQGYFELTSDSTGNLESIITNDNYKNRAYITVQEGQYLKFDGIATPVEEAEAYKVVGGTYPEGTYMVGKDIPAGEYKISSQGDGYYEVSTNSSGSMDAIVTNENFSGDVYLTVSEGQYLKLNRAQIIN